MAVCLLFTLAVTAANLRVTAANLRLTYVTGGPHL